MKKVTPLPEISFPGAVVVFVVAETVVDVDFVTVIRAGAIAVVRAAVNAGSCRDGFKMPDVLKHTMNNAEQPPLTSSIRPIKKNVTPSVHSTLEIWSRTRTKEMVLRFGSGIFFEAGGARILLSHSSLVLCKISDIQSGLSGFGKK